MKAVSRGEGEWHDEEGGLFSISHCGGLLVVFSKILVSAVIMSQQD
jgi:hypothetical protein